MPNLPPRACLTKGCSNYAVEGTARCADCTKTEEARQSVQDYHREWAFMYQDPRWKKPGGGLRARILRRDPVCKLCKRARSTVADHIKDHRGDWKLFLDPTNLQGVCDPCHHAKTGREHGPGERKQFKPALVDGKIQDFPLE